MPNNRRRYAASKAGLIGLVQSLASDHAAEGIRINSILPGGTKTALAGDDPATHDFIAKLHPMKRMATPTEIAQAALFLLSDRASFVTGAAPCGRRRYGSALAVISRAKPLIVGRKPGQRPIKIIPIWPSQLREILNFRLKKSQLSE